MKRLSQYIHKLISFSKVIHLVSAVRFLDRSEGADQFKVEYSMKQMHLPRVCVPSHTWKISFTDKSIITDYSYSRNICHFK